MIGWLSYNGEKLTIKQIKIDLKIEIIDLKES